MAGRRSLPDGSSGDQQPVAAVSGSGGALAVIRMSGRNCLELLRPLTGFSSMNPAEARRLLLTDIRDPKNQEVIDRAMVVWFNGPASFTGEDSAEIHCHGGDWIVRRILEILLDAGFHPAGPGEFTKRAFLNGKMDLTQAEGVNALVTAASQQQWLAARHLATGRLSERIQNLRDQLVGAMALLEAGIDFPDEGDTAGVDRRQVMERVAVVEQTVRELAATWEDGQVAARGLQVSLLGEPNAGKSTLLNTLLDRDRAIVTPEAGTTRDYIEESCLIDGRLIRLVDTAGVRRTQNRVEEAGVGHALRLAEEADLVLVLLPVHSDPQAARQAAAWLREFGGKARLVGTKADLPGEAGTGQPVPEVRLSCRTGAGLRALKELLRDEVDRHVRAISDQPFVTSPRHRAALQNCLACLARFTEAARADAYEEMLAFELQGAARALASVIGAVHNEDLLDRIFAEFCIGK